MSKPSTSARNDRSNDQVPISLSAGRPDRRGSSWIRRTASDQRAVFLLVGAVNTGFGFAVFTALELTLGQVTGYMVVLLIAFVLGILEAFALYRRFVFKVKGNVLLDLLRFSSVYLASLAINVVSLPLLVEVARLPVILAQAIVVVATALISFVGHKHFSFRRGRVTT
jgi:putative flippase GtrA